MELAASLAAEKLKHTGMLSSLAVSATCLACFSEERSGIFDCRAIAHGLYVRFNVFNPRMSPASRDTPVYSAETDLCGCLACLRMIISWHYELLSFTHTVSHFRRCVSTD